MKLKKLLEKMEKFMQDAVHKMAQSERDGAQVDALSRRIIKINKELAEERKQLQELETARARGDVKPYPGPEAALPGLKGYPDWASFKRRSDRRSPVPKRWSSPRLWRRYLSWPTCALVSFR